MRPAYNHEAGAPIVSFETFETDTDTFIEPGPVGGGDFEYQLLSHLLPPSTSTTGRYHILLRNGDTIAYEKYGLKIAVDVQRAPLEAVSQTPGADTQTETPPASSAMADSPHQDQELSVNTSYETVATEPIVPSAAEDSETHVDDDDLDTPSAAPALPPQ